MASAEVIQYNLKFTLSEDQTFYSVRKADGVEIGYELRIPAEIEGLPVKEIEAEAFAGDTSINIVIIPESVITIGDRAFKDCTSLQGIVIPRTVENYGYRIFENVPKTFRILRSEFETSILNETDDRLAFTLSDDGTFYYVKAANTYISGDIEIPEEYNGLPVKEIDDWGFQYCASLTSINIPDGVTSIGNSAFSGCKALTSINIPDSVTSIETYAFYRCITLTSVTIGNGVTSIGDRAFYQCITLISVIIGNSVTSIGEYAFHGCKALTSITIPDSVTSIVYYAFGACSALTSITVDPDNTVYKSDGNCLIEKATNMLILGCKTSIIPNDVTSIGRNAFSSCTALTSIIIPDSVTSIGGNAFSLCSALTSINIPDGVTSIGSGAFAYCSGLTSIIIPDSVTTIGNSAFSSCSKLTSVTIGNSVTSIGNFTFQSCSLLTSINIPDSVTSIGEYAFHGCSKLTSVTIGNSVTSIEQYVFYQCTALTSVTIPDSVTSIGNSSFRNCSKLTSITIPGSVTSIGSDAFELCTSLKTVILGKGLKTLGGTSASTGSFYNCTALTTVINKSNYLVTPNNTYPFYGCNNLTKVYFTSTTAGYVDGGTWCGRTLEYMKWNGTDPIAIDADASNFTTTDETVTVDKITNTYERYTDTDPDGNTFSKDTGSYVFKYDNLTSLWICMNYYGGPQIKNNDTSYYQFCWLGTYGSEYTQYYNIVQCDSNTHEILNDIIPSGPGDYAYVYSSYDFVEKLVIISGGGL